MVERALKPFFDSKPAPVSSSDELTEEVMDDIIVRFLVNLPKEELIGERLFQNLKIAYWFFEDYVKKNIKPYNEKEFHLKVLSYWKSEYG